MKILDIRTLAGPNVFTHKPMLLMRLDLQNLTGKESYEIPGFIERLLELLPGVRQHHCARGRAGGFVERLHEGTYFGHIVEHVALELSDLAGIPVHYGKTIYAGEPGIYDVAVRYKAEQGMRYLLQTAVELVEALVRGNSFPLAERINEAAKIVARTELGPSARAIVEAAERRGIPWIRLGGGSLVQLGYGKNRKFIQSAMSGATSAIGVDIAADKALTKIILRQAALPVPQAEIVETEEAALAAFADIGGAVVVKPLDGRQGKGVSLKLTTPEQVRRAFHTAREFSSRVLVEEMLSGCDYRVLVVGGAVVAASERYPCHVVGDGEHTIAELIEIENRNPLRGEGHEKPLTKIVIDSILFACLEKRGLTLNDTPPKGERVFLRESANLSTGGTAVDVTDKVHPDVKRVCERAARAVGLDICGVDLILKDISAPFEKGSGGIVEVNAAPGLRMHHYPSAGQRRDAGQAIVDMLYPAGQPARIPIISITGTNGKTTVTRMIAHILSGNGATVGMTTTDGIDIAGERIARGDLTGPQSARTVLSDPTVDVAVLETARGGIVRRGLGYDWSDISVMTNIRGDHIGQDGIARIEDLVHVKSLVAERVREGGTLILNADDKHLVGLKNHPRVNGVKKSIVYFSLSEYNLLIARHAAAGGRAYFLKDGWIMEAEGRSHYQVVQASAIPTTLGGAAPYQVANAMAAIAAARAYGVSREQAAHALLTFDSEQHNPGRTNLYAVAGGYVLIDYGHNPDAFESVAHMATRWHGRRVTGVVGVPGDRHNDLIAQAGRAAARGFHRLIVKEDKDTRGRERGEVAELLCQAIKEEAPGIECQLVLDEREAIDQAIQTMGEGEIVVIFYEKLEPVLEALQQYEAVPTQAIAEMPEQINVARD